jgi:pyridoxine 4-dehydrogenase
VLSFGLDNIFLRCVDVDPAQIAIAWLLARSPITLPISGTSSVAHLEENVTAIRIHLSPPELAELS